jgi:hypothetical protein
MDVFAPPNHQNQLQGPLRFLFTGHYVFFTTRPEQPGHEADHWPTPCTEVKNEWSDTTTVTCLCGVHSDSFTSTFYFSRYMTQQPHSLLYFQFKTADLIPQLSFKQKEFSILYIMMLQSRCLLQHRQKGLYSGQRKGCTVTIHSGSSLWCMASEADFIWQHTLNVHRWKGDKSGAWTTLILEGTRILSGS